MARFDGKVILISGGARGMGATEARLLAAEGARIVIGDVLVEQGEKLAAELGTSCVFVKLDVADPADWDRAIAAATALGGLHGLVNNAGVYIPKSLPDTDLGNWERHLRINQTGVYLGMKAGAAAMTTGAAIVNLSSTAGLRGTPHAFAYGATKWAVRGMTKSAATELAGRGIRVNSVHPGPIDTDMIKIRPPADLAQRVAQVPQKRMGTAEEVAKLVLFLLSDDASYITGAEMAVDGGASL